MAISGTIVQSGGAGALGAGSITVNGASEDQWASPTAGNVLIAVTGTDNNGASVTIDALSGWTRLASGSGTESSYAVDAKVSDGTETTVTVGITGTSNDRALVLAEFSGTDLDSVIANWQASADNTNLVNNVTSQATPSLVNTVQSALVLYLWPFESGSNWDLGRTVSQGTEQLAHTELNGGFRPGVVIASEVVSASAARTSTMTETDSAGKVAGVTLIIPASRVMTAADGTVQIGESGLTHAPVSPGTEVFTASPAFSSAINGATLDPDGAAIDITSLLSSLSTTNATLTAPDVSLFRVGGAWNAIRWGVDYVIRFTDGTDTADVNCKFTAPVPTRFGAIVTPNATYHPGAAIATDESYGLFTVGEGTHDPADGDTTANIFVAGVATFQPFAYDISAGAWIEGTAQQITDLGFVGGSTFANKRQCNAVAAQGRPITRVLELRRFRTPNRRPRLPGRRIRRSR